MDPDEVMRLMRIIRDNGHTPGYMKQTRAELDEHGGKGMAERVFGSVPATEYNPAEPAVLACTVILPGEVLTLHDNKTAPCAWGCGRTVQHRPWVPPDMQPVCLYCLSERKAEDN